MWTPEAGRAAPPAAWALQNCQQEAGGERGSQWGSRRAAPPTGLAGCEVSASPALLPPPRAQPPLPSPGLFTNEAGVATEAGRAERGVVERGVCGPWSPLPRRLEGVGGSQGASVRWVTAPGLHLFEGGRDPPPPRPGQASRHERLWVPSDLRARLGQAQPQWTLGALASPLWGVRPALPRCPGRGMPWERTQPSSLPHTHQSTPQRPGDPGLTELGSDIPGPEVSQTEPHPVSSGSAITQGPGQDPIAVSSSRPFSRARTHE